MKNSVPIRNTADYSPFGVQLDGRTIQGDFYRFGFQSYETDNEVKGQGNSYATEFRQYDSRLGRWLTIDPLLKKYSSMSPYNSFGNNPIIFVDNCGDSITVYGTILQKIVTLVVLQKLTNDKLVLKNGQILISRHGSENSNKDLNSGTGLLREIISNKNTVHIFQNNLGKKFNSGMEGLPIEWESNGVGSSSKISIDFSKPSYLPVANKQTGLPESGFTPLHISLGHELIHAYYKLIGKSIPDEIQATYTYKNENNRTERITEEKEETETVGITGNRKYTENKLRNEQGYRKRVKY